MSYAHAVENIWAIGSGVKEAACKVIVKQRLGGAGMKWGSRGAAVVLTLRALNYSASRWAQFWKKLSNMDCLHRLNIESAHNVTVTPCRCDWLIICDRGSSEVFGKDDLTAVG